MIDFSLLDKAYGKKDISKLYPKDIITKRGYKMRVWVRGDKIQVTKELIHTKLMLLAEHTAKRKGIKTFRVDFFKDPERNKYTSFEIKDGSFYARTPDRHYEKISDEEARKFLQKEFKTSKAVSIITQSWGDDRKKLWVDRKKIPSEHINTLKTTNKLLNFFYKITERLKNVSSNKK